jgi:hypothetical protein
MHFQWLGSVAAVGSVPSSPSPDFLCEFGPALWRGFVNDAASGIMCAATVF